MTLIDFLNYDIPREENIILVKNIHFNKMCTNLEKYNNFMFVGETTRANNTQKILDIKIPKNINTILIGKTDTELNDNFISKLPKHIRHIYGNNSISKKSNFFPMGRDFRNIEIYNNVIKKNKKDNLCYCNFSLNTHRDRKIIYNKIKDKDFIKFEHMGKFLNYNIPRIDFVNNLANSKYCICPRGNAIDTFRFWDCLYLGTIPIVVKEKIHDNLDLPIFFVDSVDDFNNLSEDMLNEKYEEFLHTDYNYDKLKLSYWESLIVKDITLI